MKNDIHYMLDIETLANDPDSAVLSVAAVEFNIYDPDLKERIRNGDFSGMRVFEIMVDPSKVSALDRDTLMWWFQQGAPAQKALSATKPLTEKQAVDAFSAWCAGPDPIYDVALKKRIFWMNGLSFDMPILRSMYHRCGYKRKDLPWEYWNGRDLRTLRKVCPKRVPAGAQLKKVLPWMEPHNAVHDCLAQIWQLLFIDEVIGLYV